MMDLWHLADIDWLRELPDDQLTALQQRGNVREFDRGATIFEPEGQPDKVFILKKGLVRIYRLARGGDEV